MVGPFGFHPNKTMRSRAMGLARPLAHRGHAVCLIMPPWQTPSEAGRSWQEDGVQIRYTRLHGGLVGITWRLIRETLAWRPDVVHGYKPKAYSGLVMWWLWQTRRYRLRLVLDADDWEGWGGWNEIAGYSFVQKRFFAWQERWGYRHCHALTVASRTLQSRALSQGIPAERVSYVPNGPGIESGGQRSDLESSLAVELGERPTLLLYSRLFEFDTQRLANVLGHVRSEIPDLAILGVGTGLNEADAAQFRQQLAAEGLLERFMDVGWVEPELLPSLFAAADVGIYLMDDTLLNRAKCPVKLADMLSLGVPVVAEAVGQVTEYVIQGQSGLLRPSGDTAGLAEDLIYLLQNGAEAARLAAGARKHISERFNWEYLSQLVEAAYVGGGA
jgi:glycosyltransferase involved in cell wall biosynthesis